MVTVEVYANQTVAPEFAYKGMAFDGGKYLGVYAFAPSKEEAHKKVADLIAIETAKAVEYGAAIAAASNAQQASLAKARAAKRKAKK